MDKMCPNANPLGQRLLKDYDQTLQAWIPCLESYIRRGIRPNPQLTFHKCRAGDVCGFNCSTDCFGADVG